VIEHGQVLFEDVIELIRGQARVWVRLGAARAGETWTVLAYDVVGPIQPPSWQNLIWEYPAAAFHSFSESGQTVGQWLSVGEITIDNREFMLPGLPREPPNPLSALRAGDFLPHEWSMAGDFLAVQSV
jgi:hypothetical protein